MSTIPNSAMPHAYANDEEDRGTAPDSGRMVLPSPGKLIGGAVAAFLLYKVLR